MPMIVNLRLRALADCRLDAAHGEQAHAAFLKLLATVDPSLAGALHDQRGGKPFAVGIVGDWGRDGRRSIGQGHIVSWRVSLLHDEIAAVTCRALACLPPGEEGQVQIGTGRFAIESSSNRPRDGGDSASFADLLEEGARQANNTVDIELVTPLAFSLGQQEWGKRIEMFPLPELVFGSLLRRWNQYAPPEHTLPAELQEWAKQSVVVARYSLRSVAMNGSKGPQLGSIGRVSYRAMAEPSCRQIAEWQTLAAFARFSAIGYRTTMGWGQVRCLAPTERDGHRTVNRRWRRESGDT